MSRLYRGNQQSRLPDYDEWIKLRTERNLACLYDSRLQEAEKKICANDLKHFVRYWGWIFCPWNPPELKEMMFIPFDFQEDLMDKFLEGMALVENQHSFKRVNLVIEKARDMAASWTSAITALWDCMFHNGTHIFLSRLEDAVDKKGDMKSIFEKIRFFFYRLPEWMRPDGFNKRVHDKHMLFINPKGGEISGEASTANSSRSGRAKVVWFDEFAFFPRGLDDAAWGAASQTAKMRVAISTPNGKHNRFYRLVRPVTDDDDEGQEVISLPWYIHPEKSQGLCEENGKLVSPWYIETKRSMNRQTFAKEVEIDYNLSIKGWVFGPSDDDPVGYDWQHKNDKLKPEKGRRIIVGFDPGIQGAIIWGQIDSYGRLLLLKEHVFEEAKLEAVISKLKDINERYFDGFEFEYFGDPAGAHRTVSNQPRSEYLEMWLTHQINVEYNFMNRIPTSDRVETRIIAIQNKMTKRCDALDTPMLLINPKECPKLDAAFAGDYRRKISATTGEVMQQIDEEHPYEDVVDATGFILLGKGEGAGMIGQSHRRNQSGIKSKSRSISWRVPGG